MEIAVNEFTRARLSVLCTLLIIVLLTFAPWGLRAQTVPAPAAHRVRGGVCAARSPERPDVGGPDISPMGLGENRSFVASQGLRRP